MKTAIDTIIDAAPATETMSVAIRPPSAKDKHVFTYYNNPMSVIIVASARKHGVTDADINNAIDNSILDTYEIPPDFDPPRFLIIGPNLEGVLLELIGLESDQGDDVIFHAMKLRPIFNDLLPPSLRA